MTSFRFEESLNGGLRVVPDSVFEDHQDVCLTSNVKFNLFILSSQIERWQHGRELKR